MSSIAHLALLLTSLAKGLLRSRLQIFSDVTPLICVGKISVSTFANHIAVWWKHCIMPIQLYYATNLRHNFTFICQRAANASTTQQMQWCKFLMTERRQKLGSHEHACFLYIQTPGVFLMHSFCFWFTLKLVQWNRKTSFTTLFYLGMGHSDYFAIP